MITCYETTASASALFFQLRPFLATLRVSLCLLLYGVDLLVFPIQIDHLALWFIIIISIINTFPHGYFTINGCTRKSLFCLKVGRIKISYIRKNYQNLLFKMIQEGIKIYYKVFNLFHVLKDTCIYVYFLCVYYIFCKYR